MKYLTILFSLFFLFGCSKEKSNKWLIADITVVDKHTGEPLQCDLVLNWKNTTLFGSSSHSVNLGETDAQGKMHIEREVSRKDESFTLDFWADQTHYGFPGVNNSQKTITLQKNSSNNPYVEIPSKSYVVVSILNANCAGPSDTLFMRSINSNYEGPYSEYIGCVDTVINGQMAYSGYIIDPILQLEYIVKRGSQIDTFQETHVLTPKEFTPINITY